MDGNLWRRHELVLGFPASRILAVITLCVALMLVVLGVICAVVFTRGSFFTQWWDWLVGFLAAGAYFGGMHLVKVWGRYSAKETDAGYTTNPFGFVDADQVHWPTGVVLREAGERHLTVKVRRMRMARVRAYQEWLTRSENP